MTVKPTPRYSNNYNDPHITISPVPVCDDDALQNIQQVYIRTIKHPCRVLLHFISRYKLRPLAYLPHGSPPFCFVFQAKNKTSVPNKSQKSNFRVIWGKVTRTHGNAGSVRAKFAKNLPPQAMGRRVRIMMYPSRI